MQLWVGHCPQAPSSCQGAKFRKGKQGNPCLESVRTIRYRRSPSRNRNKQREKALPVLPEQRYPDLHINHIIKHFLHPAYQCRKYGIIKQCKDLPRNSAPSTTTIRILMAVSTYPHQMYPELVFTFHICTTIAFR